MTPPSPETWLTDDLLRQAMTDCDREWYAPRGSNEPTPDTQAKAFAAMRAKLAPLLTEVFERGRQAGQQAWRPISTAPKDGTIILLYMAAQNARGIGYWLQRTDGGVWVWTKPIDLPVTFDGIDKTTHWMPVPEPPPEAAPAPETPYDAITGGTPGILAQMREPAASPAPPVGRETPLQCTGPFSDAFDCPVHDPRKSAVKPEPDSREYWHQIAQGLGVEAFTLKVRAESAEADATALRETLEAIVLVLADDHTCNALSPCIRIAELAQAALHGEARGEEPR